MPAPHTAAEKAAMAARLYAGPSKTALTKTRMAVGTAAIAVAVAVPSLSLDAMVGSVSGPYFGSSQPSAGMEQQAPKRVAAPAQLPTDVWTPAKQPAGPVYAKGLALEEAQTLVARASRLSAFEREQPLAVLDKGLNGAPDEEARAFDLAFANVDGPSPLTAVFSARLPSGPRPLTQTRWSAIATRTIAIEQITDLDQVVRATPENVGGEGQTLASNSASVRTDAIANRSVETAFAGVIDASAAVRRALPVAPKQPVPNPSSPPRDEARRAIPLGAPSPQVSGAAAAQSVLVPKSKLDARINGVLTGSVDFRQLDGTIAIRLRSVANMMREKFNQDEFSRLMNGQAIDSFVTLSQLQAAGIPVSYNPAYDEVEFGIDYQDAPNAKKVQVDQISVPTVRSELTAIEQIPR